MKNDEKPSEKTLFVFLLNELQGYRENGLRLALEGVPSTPEEVAAECFLFEEKGYMRDYVTNEKGIVEEINFKRMY